MSAGYPMRVASGTGSPKLKCAQQEWEHVFAPSIGRREQLVVIARDLRPFYKAVIGDGISAPSSRSCGPDSVVGSCLGCAIVPAGEVKDFYRGYALVGIPAVAIAALAGIVLFLIGMLP